MVRVDHHASNNNTFEVDHHSDPSSLATLYTQSTLPGNNIILQVVIHF